MSAAKELIELYNQDNERVVQAIKRVFAAMSFKNSQHACGKRADELYKYLSGKDVLPEGLILSEHASFGGTPSFCLRISGFNQNSGFDTISVSVPPDANRWNIEQGNPANTFEIALVNGENLVYIDRLDYPDVCRFESFVEVIDEIKRLSVPVV
jgi:hypothetical protein